MDYRPDTTQAFRNILAMEKERRKRWILDQLPRLEEKEALSPGMRQFYQWLQDDLENLSRLDIAQVFKTN